MLTCRDEFEKVEDSEKVQNKKNNNSDIFLFFVQTFIVNYFRLSKSLFLQI